MPRGKPFICWLSSPGHHHDVALHIGDEVEYDSGDDGWVRARIGRKRATGMYVARRPGKVEHVFMLCSLRPIRKGE